MGVSLETAAALVLPYVTVPNILGLALVLVGAAVYVIRRDARVLARQAVAAAYRNALKAAEQLQEEGIRWLLSDEGASYRKAVVNRAYDLLPTTIGPVPVGVVVRTLITRERFAQMVEAAFCEALEVARRIDIDGDGA